jgi:hypothetical protein
LPNGLFDSEDLPKRLDVTIEVIVNLPRGKSRDDALYQRWRIRQRIAKQNRRRPTLPDPFVTARDNPQIHDSSRATNKVPQQSLCGLRAGLALAFQKIGKD